VKSLDLKVYCRAIKVLLGQGVGSLGMSAGPLLGDPGEGTGNRGGGREVAWACSMLPHKTGSIGLPGLPARALVPGHFLPTRKKVQGGGTYRYASETLNPKP